jgi:hypothetical protein
MRGCGVRGRVQNQYSRAQYNRSPVALVAHFSFGFSSASRTLNTIMQTVAAMPALIENFGGVHLMMRARTKPRRSTSSGQRLPTSDRTDHKPNRTDSAEDTEEGAGAVCGPRC